MDNIQNHPSFNLTLKQLLDEKEKIIAFNKRISKPGYKFKDTIKPKYPMYLDALIKAKSKPFQLSLGL